MILPLNDSWNKVLQSEYDKPYFAELAAFTDRERAAGKTVFPAEENVFKAFDLCSPENVKVVILGQDPYHEEGQAMGLSFSVPDTVKAPPSLKNIFKELQSDLEIMTGGSTDLTPWAKQGVLLVNSILTVRKGEAASHRNIGWQQFTDAVISILSADYNGIVFMLWGNYARSKAALIDRSRHLVLEAAHPSPLARGAFFGSRPFSQANDYLRSIGRTAIDWTI